MDRIGLHTYIAGKTGVHSGRTPLDRIANLARAVLGHIFRDLKGPSPRWRADAERFFDADHADHFKWLCEAAAIDPVYIWRYYHRTKAGLLAARTPAVRPGKAVHRVRPS